MILNFIYNSPVGAMKNENEFSGNVSNKTGSSYMISVLSFPSVHHKGVAIMCDGFNDDDVGICSINTTYPSKERKFKIVSN